MKKRLFLTLLALFLLVGCGPPQLPSPSASVTAPGTLMPAPETTIPAQESPAIPETISVRDFFFDKLDPDQQDIYLQLENWDITDTSPLLFDSPVPLSSEKLDSVIDTVALYNSLHAVGEWRNGKFQYILNDEGTDGVAVTLSGVQRMETITPIGSVAEMAEAYDAAFARWLAQLPGENAPDAEKVVNICDLMCREIHYNYDAYNAITDNMSWDRFSSGSEYGAVVYGTTVCGGYAMTFQALAQALGLESMVLEGDTPSGHHAWNLVQVDGQWYHVDVTWMDDDTNTPDTTWLLRSDAEFSYTHQNFTLPKDDGHEVPFQPPAAPQSWWEP